MPRTSRDPRPPRPAQGKRLLDLRKAAGLSQMQLARLLGQSQRNIAFWEQSDKPPRSDLLPRLAEILGVRLEDLLDVDKPLPKRSGPPSRMRLVFDEVAQLPRAQREKVVEFVETLLEQFRKKAS